MKTETKYRIVPQAFTFGGEDITRGYPDGMGDFAEAMDCSIPDAMLMLDQYSYDAYFEGGCDEDDFYASEEEAHAAYKGDDTEGVGVRYEVEPVTAA